MIRFWTYQAVSSSGQEVKGSFQGKKEELMSFLEDSKLTKIHVGIDWGLVIVQNHRFNRLSTKTMSVFFEDLANMHESGMGITHMFMSLSDGVTCPRLLRIIKCVHHDIENGLSLAEALGATQVFPWIVISTVNSGEQSGKLTSSLRILANAFRRQDEVMRRLRDAMVYPMIVFCLLIIIMLFVGLNVIPKLKQLLPETADVKGAAGFVLMLSHIMKKHCFIIVSLPIVGAMAGAWVFSQHKRLFDALMYQLPILGRIIKESELSYYLMNLSILLGNGLPLIKCIDDLYTHHESFVSRHFYGCRDYLFGGMSFWESLKMDSFFPSVLVLTIRRGEEMARLSEYCGSLSDYFNKRVSDRIDRAVLLLQPALLAIGAVFLLIIAFAFLLPVYGSLNQIAGG